jgi:poly-gamma-glutamate synthesis protein (capsule biosynthesis protein)
MYFATLEPTGRLALLRMVPLQILKFRLERAARADAAWLKATLDRESSLDRNIELSDDGSLTLAP